MEDHPTPAVEQTVPQKRTWLKPVIVLGVIGAIVLLWIFDETPVTASRTEVGACLKGDVDDAESVRNVECGTPEANFKVVGKQDGKSEGGLMISGGSECGEYPNADLYYYQGRRTTADGGVLLCLENLKNPGARLPAVGDCLPGDAFAAKKLETVDCAGAHFKVLAIEKESEVSTGTTCASVPATDMKLTWTSGVGGLIPREHVLCLDELK
ncbi:hypothetical protein ACIBCH_22395 [Amycolatopsis thailandensis]|uniref:LppU/SCO3897 family protein n=1 Tax=Amycolatopsis thailandensis TaxID=589330 RepID=UPI00379F0186